MSNPDICQSQTVIRGVLIMNAQPQFITDADGNKVSVILPINEYQELLEDLEDLAAIAERKDEITIPFETALEQIGYDLQDQN